MRAQSICLTCISIERSTRSELLAMAALRLWWHGGSTMCKIDGILHRFHLIVAMHGLPYMIDTMQHDTITRALDTTVLTIVSWAWSTGKHEVLKLQIGTHLCLVPLMPCSCMSVCTALAGTGEPVSTAFVLVEVLISDLQLLAVRTSLVCDPFDFHECLAARFDGLRWCRLSRPVLQRLKRLSCNTGTLGVE